MARSLSVWIVAVSFVVSTSGTAGPPPTNLANATYLDAQARSYAVPSKIAFNAAISALQDMGYVDIVANRDAGTISAAIDSKAKTTLNVFWGFGKKKWSQKAQVLVEDQGVGSTIRLNLAIAETKQRQNWGLWGSTFSDAEPVREPTPYVDYFHQVNLEISRRGGSAQTSVAFTPDASGRIDLGGVRLRPARTQSGFCIDAGPDYVGTGAANMPSVTSAMPRCDALGAR